MKKFLLINLLGLAMLAAMGSAQADIIFFATLTHDQEVDGGGNPTVPINEGSGGTAKFVLNDAQTRLTYDVQLFGLDLSRVNPATGNPNVVPDDANTDDDALRLHIHRNFVGLNGAIVFGMIDASAGLRNDNNPNDLVIDIQNLHITGAWDLPEGAGGATLATELANLFAEGLYINVHTEDHTGGEIRGQILIPEPGVLALFVIGMFGVMVGLRRRRV